MFDGQVGRNNLKVNEIVPTVSAKERERQVLQSHSGQDRFEMNFSYLPGDVGQLSMPEVNEITPLQYQPVNTHLICMQTQWHKIWKPVA